MGESQLPQHNERRTPPVEFGVVSLATSLGESCLVADTAHHYGAGLEQLSRLGYERYHRAAEGVTTAQLGADAGRAALDRAGVAPSEVGYLVVANGATVPDYLNWDVSTAIAAGLGLTTVPTLLTSQGCAAAVLAFQQAAGIFAVRPDVDVILLIAVDRVSERHTRRMSATVDSDGAASAVLRRGHSALRWLATEQVTDAEFSDFFRLEFCGNAASCVPDPNRNLRVDPAYQVYQYFRDEPDRMVEWAAEVDRRVVDAVEGACKRAGLTRSDVSHWITLNDSQPSMAAVARAADIPLDRTNAQLASQLGHFGSGDPLICLSRYHDDGLLRRGDVVALAGMSSGMHWFCTLIEI